jgi:hypothetical protein
MKSAHVLRADLSLAWLAVCPLLVLGGAQPALALYHDRGYGEPYQLFGNRIVFTSWYWVRPGQWDWQDDDGRSVFADGKCMAGPLDAHFRELDIPHGIRLVVEPAQREGPIIPGDKPWDSGKGTGVQALLYENGKYRLWGSCRDAKGESHACYWESADGIHWDKPNLGLVEFEGSKENNLIPSCPGCLFADPKAPPEERYKAYNNGDFDPALFESYKERRPWSRMSLEPDPGRVHAIFAYLSPDGYHWTKVEEPVAVEVADGPHTGYFDELIGKYVIYHRAYMVGPRADDYPLRHERWHQFLPRRAIGRSESANFREFPLSELVIETANDMGPTETFYTAIHTTVPGAPTDHLMFPAVYMQERDTTRIDLYTSTDGKMWHRAPGPPVLETAPFGQWDGGCIFAYPNLVERADGSWALPYVGYNVPHKYPRGKFMWDTGLAVWPKGRLMALEASEKGAFTTPAFLPPGTKMRINALTERAGSILVEVADFHGTPLPGRTFDDAIPIVGDHFRTPVTWKGGDDLGAPAGEPVLLRLRMDRAKLYWLEFE